MKKIVKLVLIVLLLLVTLFVIKKVNNLPFLSNGKKVFTTDTITKIDTFYIKQKPIIIKDTIFKYIINTKETDSVIKVYKDSINRLTNEKDRINYLLKELSIKDYDSTYYFGLNKINIKDKVSGKIIDRELTFYPYNTIINKDKVITNKYYPNYAWSVGGNLGLINTGFNMSQRAFLGGSIEYKNSKGLQYQIEYSKILSPQNDAYILKIGVLKEIFVNYKK